ncbi:MAG: apolipoprotein N-acyltransferase [Pseudomonadota bacterium]
MSVWKARGVWVALGLSLSLIHEPFGLWPLAFGALAAAIWLTLRDGLGLGGFWQGWWLGLGYFMGSLNWLISPFFVEPEIYGWMAPFALFGMSGALAVYWGLAFAVSQRLAGLVPRPVLLVLLWTAMEAARGILWTGFPWAMFAKGFVETGFGQALALIGPHGLGLLILFMAALPFLTRRFANGGALAAVIFAGIEGWGQWRLTQDRVDTDFQVRIMQTNNDQEKKWDPDFKEAFFQDNLELSARNGTPDIVIWPENALTWNLNDTPTRRADIAIAALGGVPFVGGYHNRGRYFHNALARLGRTGAIEHLYDKHHLVPFGEVPPLAGTLDRFGYAELYDRLGLSYWTPGARPDVVLDPELPPYLPQICYESIFTRYSFAPSGRPDWIVLVTNDAWFGNFSGPYQHLAQAQMRAIEQGLPIARAANTGVSAMIDARGRIVAELPLNRRDVIDVALPEPIEPTLYARLGFWPSYLLGVFILILGLGIKSRETS